MKINYQTVFPLSLVVLGGLIFFGDGSKAFTFVYPYPIGYWQQVIGVATLIIGFVLYKRSVKYQKNGLATRVELHLSRRMK